MFTRAQILAAVLVLLAAFAAGFYLDRMNHTITIHLGVHCTPVTHVGAGLSEKPRESGAFPRWRRVCTSFDTVCWKTT